MSTHAEVDVLLLDAECRQTLAAMRAYTRAGLSVGAVVCESEAYWAPSPRSRHCALALTAPNYSTDPNGYVDAVVAAAKQHRPHLIVPALDGSIEALRPRRGELEPLTPLALASEAALEVAVSKAKTLALASELGIAVPRSARVDCLSDVPGALRHVGFPAVMKPVQSWVQRDGSGVRLSSEPVVDENAARRSLEYVLSAGGQALLQQWLPGRREAVSLFYAHGRFWARMAQLSHREWPVLGGVSVLCETMPLLPDITAQAERLVRAIDLEGCSMVEFRRDENGQPVLMEVNPRIGGSVALAISSGVDFTRLLYDWKVTGDLHEVAAYRVGRRLRWLTGDIWHLKCVYSDQGEPDVPSRASATAAFVLDWFRPGINLDVVDALDMRPALAEFNKMVLRHGMNRVRRHSPIKWLSQKERVN